MSRNNRKNQRNTHQQKEQQIQSRLDMQYTVYQDVNEYQKQPQKQLVPLNKKQKEYLNLINTKQITIAIGSAGTGKTFVPAFYAATKLLNKEIGKIIITRPAIEAYGEKLGSLPGTLEEKMMPYLAPFISTFEQVLGNSFLDYCLKNKKIEVIPLAFMNGRSFTYDYSNIILADEFQNTNKEQALMILTRIGPNSKLIITGDLKQRNNFNSVSGLADAINRTSSIDGVGYIEFFKEDIVRCNIIQEIIEAYEN
jgi:phosphate starvation-inducible PhoH-like protein